jgi:hypothetical protein
MMERSTFSSFASDDDGSRLGVLIIRASFYSYDRVSKGIERLCYYYALKKLKSMLSLFSLLLEVLLLYGIIIKGSNRTSARRLQLKYLITT